MYDEWILFGLLIHLYLQNGYLAFIKQGGNVIGNEYTYFLLHGGRHASSYLNKAVGNYRTF